MKMGNPLNNATTTKQADINELFEQFKQNPAKYLSGLNIPQNMNDPRQIVQYLSQSGRIPPALQQRVNAMFATKYP